LSTAIPHRFDEQDPAKQEPAGQVALDRPFDPTKAVPQLKRFGEPAGFQERRHRRGRLAQTHPHGIQ